MRRRKPGTLRTGDIVQLKGSTRQRTVHSVYWTEKGDVVKLSLRTPSRGPFPAEKFELVLPTEQRICWICDLYIYGPEHLASSCPVR